MIVSPVRSRRQEVFPGKVFPRKFPRKFPGNGAHTLLLLYAPGGYCRMAAFRRESSTTVSPRFRTETGTSQTTWFAPWSILP